MDVDAYERRTRTGPCLICGIAARLRLRIGVSAPG